jgi:hypothetical protein
MVWPARRAAPSGLFAQVLRDPGGHRDFQVRLGRGHVHHGLLRRDASHPAPRWQAASRAMWFVALESILPQPEAVRSSTGLAPVRRLVARVASEPLEAWPREALVQPSVRPEEPGVLHAAARLAVWLPVVSAPWAVLHEAGEPPVVRVRRAAVSDERALLSEPDLSAAIPSALSRVRVHRVTQPARTGSAWIGSSRSIAWSSATQQREPMWPAAPGENSS